MKRVIKAALAAVMLFGSGFSAMAQTNPEEDTRYGGTLEERKKNLGKLNFMRDEMTNKNYAEAAVFLKDLMNDAPLASSNIYMWGVTIYKNKFAKATSAAEKKVYLDSILLIYDRRGEHYGTSPTKGTPYILSQKARDYAALAPMDRAGVRGYYHQAVEANAAKPDGALINEYFQQLVNDYKGVELKPEDLIAEYERLAPMMERVDAADRDRFTTLFATSGAASCEVLEKSYTQLLAADPGNVDLLAKAFNLMSQIDCQSDFYISVAEKYYAAQPASITAIRLASVFESRKEYGKALKYLNEMLSSESDPAAKANLYVRIAASELGLNRPSAAAQASRSAIALSPDNGYAHLFLAESYIAGSGACKGFEAQTVFWLAYDELARARQALAGEGASVASVDSRMALCKANFPTFDDAFMTIKNYEDGMPYHVSCGWISGNTTTRRR